MLIACTLTAVCVVALQRPYPAPLTIQPIGRNSCREEPVSVDHGWRTLPCYRDEWFKEMAGGVLTLRLTKGVMRFSFTLPCSRTDHRPLVHLWGGTGASRTFGCPGMKFKLPTAKEIGEPPRTPWDTVPGESLREPAHKPTSDEEGATEP